MKVPEPRRMSSGNYFIQLRLNGVSTTVTASTAKECRRQAAAIKAEYQAGKREIGAQRKKTLDEAIGDYIDKRRNVLSPVTIRAYQFTRKFHFQDVMQREIGDDIDWQKAINREAAQYSAKTVKNAWGLVSSALHENDVPVPRVRLPQQAKTERPWLEPEQTREFIAVVKDEPFAIPALLALHGLRRSEIYGLDWGRRSIDLKKGVIHVSGAVVPDEHGKFVHKVENKNTSSARDVPIMIPELRALLEAVPEKHGCITSIYPNTLCKQINRACRNAGLPEVGVHGLRHSFASLCYHLGLSELETMELGGWADYQTVRKIYTHLASADRLSAKNKIAAFYAESR